MKKKAGQDPRGKVSSGLADDVETRYRELFDHISSGVAVYEAVDDGNDFIIRDFNQAACAIEKVNKEDVIGKSVLNAFPGVVEFGILNIFRQVWKTGQPEHFPISQYKDQRIAGWRDNYIYKLPSGEIVAVYSDITEQKKILEELELTNERLELALRGADLGLYDNNIKTGAIFINDQYVRMLGYEPGEIDFNLDQFFKLVHPEDLPVLIQKLLDYFKSNSTELIQLEYRMHHKSGKWIWVVDRGRIVGWDADGNCTRIAGTHLEITPHKQAEQALQQSEEKYRNIFENATEGIFQSTPEGKYITVNPAFAGMAGYESPDDMIKSIVNIGRQLYARAEDRDNLKALLDDPGYVRDYIAEIRRKDGSQLWIAINAKCVREEDGTVIYYEGTTEDITERKLSEEALKESERAYRDTFETAPIGIFNTTVDGQMLSANSELARILGYSSTEEVIAVADESGIAAAFYADPARRLQIMDEMLNQSGWPQYEVDLKRKDGSIITCLLQIRIVKIKGGSIDHLEGFIQDITARKQALEALERQREEYRTIFDSVPAFIAYIDGKGTFMRINRPAAASIGYTPKQMVGKTFFDIFPYDEAAILNSMNSEVFNSGMPITGSMNIFTTRKGETRWHQNDIAPYFDGKGKIVGTILFGEDITQRMEAEHGLKLSYEALHRALEGSVNAIAKIVEMKDPYTAGHQARVAELAAAIARELKLPEDRVDYIHTAARMHDVGKIYVPSDILSKPGKLTRIEFEIIKTHAQGSYDILKSIDFPGPVALIALQHHERLNGSGYPNGISDDAIIPEARILAVADVVEAMISYRPYRPALGIDKALEEIIKGKDELYDGDAVSACVRLFQEKNFTFATPRAF
jgi:PAS domain S-box-containing protein